MNRVVWVAVTLLSTLAGPANAARPLGPGDPVPDLSVVDRDGRTEPLARHRVARRPFVVLFWGPGCPCSAECEAGADRLLARVSASSPGGVVAIDPVSRPEERASVVAERTARGTRVPLRFDPDQSAARRFGVRTTPTVFVFDANGRLAYRGAFERLADPDGTPLQPTTGDLVLQPWSPDRKDPVTWPFAEAAVEALLRGEHPRYRWVRPTGCPVLLEPPLPPLPEPERTLFSK